MRNAILSITAALSILAALPTMANAEVIERIGPAPVQIGVPVVPVGYYCGRGFFLDRWGHCRPMRYAPPPRRRYLPPPPPPHHFRRCVNRWTPYGWRRFCRVY